MNRESVLRLAIESGLCDADLSTSGHVVTDYGDATDAVLRFADDLDKTKTQRIEQAEALLSEVVEAMINLAPAVRRERDGCFGNRRPDCCCTTCRVRRFLANDELTGTGDEL